MTFSSFLKAELTLTSAFVNLAPYRTWSLKEDSKCGKLCWEKMCVLSNLRWRKKKNIWIFEAPKCLSDFRHSHIWRVWAQKLTIWKTWMLLYGNKPLKVENMGKISRLYLWHFANALPHLYKWADEGLGSYSTWDLNSQPSDQQSNILTTDQGIIR